MAQNKTFLSGPSAIAAAPANILNPPTVTGGVNAGSSPCYLIIKRVSIVNTTAGALTWSMWLGATGATAAGTEVFGTGTSIAANATTVIYCAQRIDSTQFLVADASATGLTVTFEGEIGVAG